MLAVRGCLTGVGHVSGELAIDDVGQAALEAAQGLHGSLAGGELAPVVGAAFGVVADLHDGLDVQDAIDPPVPRSGQPVAHLLAGGGVDGCGCPLR
jgi:hypothetical protein